MPMSCTRFETGKLVSGEAMSVTRLYDGECPHEVGARLALASRYVSTGDKDEIFADATVLKVSRSTIGERRIDMKQAIMDGFDDGPAWYRHFVQTYTGEMHDNVPVHRIHFRVDRVRKK